ncbi:hypothetical protein SBA7_1480004 [Candidatus Sulfotelmatobacter sp. SbA7]|nr:hypothetical protein SBA7_1480004 [Candidatus Sulfotelmatobacter sp. SbA7]
MLASVKTIQKRIVVRNDLLERECACVRRRVTVGGEDDVITKADDAAHGGINAVLGHASADHESCNASGRERRIERRFEERIASTLVDYWFGRLGCNFRPKRPP